MLAALLLVAGCATEASTSDRPGSNGGESASPAVPESPEAVSAPTVVSDGLGDSVGDEADDTVASTAAPTTSAAPETTTTTEPAPRFYDEACVVVIEPNDTLVGIVERLDDGETINRVSLRAENALLDERLTPGDTLDVCPGNGVDDATGAERLDASEELVAAAVSTNVEVQQMKLNQLFADIGARELVVDGVAGPVTRQRLCAARLALGLEVSTAEMVAGSAEERILLAAPELPPPPMATVDQDRWLLIDQTCQFMFVGAVDQLVFGFPTSTGEAGHPNQIEQSGAGISVRPGCRQRRMARLLRLPRVDRQSVERQHVQADLLRRRSGDPRRQQRPDQPAVQGLRPPHPRAPRPTRCLARPAG